MHLMENRFPYVTGITTAGQLEDTWSCSQAAGEVWAGSAAVWWASQSLPESASLESRLPDLSSGPGLYCSGIRTPPTLLLHEYPWFPLLEKEVRVPRASGIPFWPIISFSTSASLWGLASGNWFSFWQSLAFLSIVSGWYLGLVSALYHPLSTARPLPVLSPTSLSDHPLSFCSLMPVSPACVSFAE